MIWLKTFTQLSTVLCKAYFYISKSKSHYFHLYVIFKINECLNFTCCENKGDEILQKNYIIISYYVVYFYKMNILMYAKQITKHYNGIRNSTKHSILYAVKLVYNDTLGATKLCCYNQVVVVTRTFSTETIESVPAMCVVVKRLML